jgi:hypothetical protein
MQLSGRKLMRDIRKRAAAHINRFMRGALVRMRTIYVPRHAPYQIQQRAFRQSVLTPEETRWRGSMGGRKRLYHGEEYGYIDEAQNPFSQGRFQPSNRMQRRF